ncbi:alpha-2A adrenergic receptor [Limanda limanda]|uniref:alpha-2A adrenergic receptor n=1 Tax=Limanda limanda TaxID=27771 RepID=UPI0029C61EA1|nr:alpha-2A adrenergic receptor [Limanda limanda]
MAAAPDATCLSELSGFPSRNISLLSGARPCNRSAARTSPYTPQATAAFAIAITFMMVVTIVGNILVIMAVLTSRSLKGPQNLFLVSLAAADILVATLIIPFSLANELQGFWAFSSVWCEIFLALDVLFCTSSIVHLCAIALDRYLSISQPVSYGAKRTPSRIKAGIIVVWLISAVISFPPLLTLDKSEGGEEVCELNNERWYILYSTIGSFFAPCVIMILVYVRIYQIAKQHTRCSPAHKQKVLVPSEPVRSFSEKFQQNGDQGAAPAGRRGHTAASCSDSTPSTPQRPPETTMSQNPQHCPPPPSPPQKSSSSVPQPDSQTSSGPAQKHPDEGGGAPDSSSSSGSEQEAGLEEVLREDDGGETSKPNQRAVGRKSKGFRVQVLDLSSRHQSTMMTSSGTRLAPEEPPRTPPNPGAAVCRRKALVNREKRFTFVLAVVMGVFVICWFPFFFSYSLQAVCPETCSIPNPLFKFFFWIGYCNSCLNPVIYTIFNKDFRKAFKRILCRDAKGTFF